MHVLHAGLAEDRFALPFRIRRFHRSNVGAALAQTAAASQTTVAASGAPTLPQHRSHPFDSDHGTPTASTGNANLREALGK